MARDKGQEIAVTATAQDVVIGDPGHIYTFVNDDSTNDIYYRLKDNNTMAGVAAVIVATPIFGARLKAGELAHVDGGTWEVCCATGLTATLRIVPGRLMQTGDVDLAALGTLVHAEDSAHTSGDAGTMPLGVRTDTRAPLSGTTGDYTPQQMTANGDLRVRDDDLVAALNTLLTAQALLLAPPVSTGLAAVATTDAEWTSITLTANVLFADVTLEDDSAYMVCQTAEPADADTGCVYQPGIVYRIPCRGRTKIWIRRTAAQDVTIRVTDYSTA